MLLFTLPSVAGQDKPTCAYIASYDLNYNWQKEITNALKTTLSNECQLDAFYMKSKKMHTQTDIAKRANEALDFLQQNKHDIAIFSDDNAIKHVMLPYTESNNRPAIFCGPNHTTRDYQLPQESTGMIEKMPTKQSFRLFRELMPEKGLLKLAFIRPPGPSEKMDANAFIESTFNEVVTLRVVPVNSFEKWQQAFIKLQSSARIDGIILGNVLSIPDWDTDKAIQLIQKYQSKPTLSYLLNMRDYSSFTIAKSGNEQGVWAALSAIEVLQGRQASDMPIVPSHKVNIWVNSKVLDLTSNIKIPQDMLYKLSHFRSSLKGWNP